jgi:hypothetical protein
MRDYRFHVLSAPLWFVVGVFAVLPLVASVRVTRGRVRKRRRARGLCLACGYDLRASPNQCPECGVTVANLHL